jgi:glycosyltransferase involved in cell wall biosynthesis
MNNKLSATIITHNEEENIEKCLKSLHWVDEIVVVDSYSQDRTVEICKKYNCNVIQTEWLGFGKTKQVAVTHAVNDWILSIDSDEEVSWELAEKIKLILADPKYDGYKIKRNSFYLGKEINHSGWDNDFPIRLFNKKSGRFNEKEVHESVVINGEKGKLTEPLYHYTYPTISKHIGKINRYTDLAISERNNTKEYSIITSLILGVNKFLKMYFLQRGFLDGKAGFLLSMNSAIGVYLKYIKMWKPNS